MFELELLRPGLAARFFKTCPCRNILQDLLMEKIPTYRSRPRLLPAGGTKSVYFKIELRCFEKAKALKTNEHIMKVSERVCPKPELKNDLLPYF